jgi:hypothetical protein
VFHLHNVFREHKTRRFYFSFTSFVWEWNLSLMHSGREHMVYQTRMLRGKFGPKAEEVTGGWLQQILRSFMYERTGLREGALGTGIIRNMVLVKSIYHTWKNFFYNYLQLGQAPSKFGQPLPRLPTCPSCGPVCQIWGSYIVDYEDLVFWDTQVRTNSRNLLLPHSTLKEAAGIMSQNNNSWATL